MAERDADARVGGLLRGTFDDVAELYDRARPSYPPELVDELVSATGLGPTGVSWKLGRGQAS